MGKKLDWISVLEATAAQAESDDAWAARIVEVTAPIFRADDDCVFSSHVGIVHTPDCAQAAPLFVAGDQRTISEGQSLVIELGAEWFRSLFYPPRMVMSHSEMMPSLAPDIAARLRAWDAHSGVADVVGVLFHPSPGRVGVLCAGFTKSRRLDRHQRASLTRVGLHIEAGWRLRLHPERVLAVLEPSGKLAHLEDGAPPRAELEHRVRAVERARTRRERTHVESLALWRTLIAGHASLVERTEAGRRRYFVVDNPPASQPLRAFTRGEVDAVSYAARGLPAKLIGYALGIGDARVSHQLASAAAKVGVATRTEMIRIAAMLLHDPHAHFEDGALTAAERQILELLDQGLSNQAIARIRQRSVRTIANQVAALLKKTGASSRRALAARQRD